MKTMIAAGKRKGNSGHVTATQYEWATVLVRTLTADVKLTTTTGAVEEGGAQ